VAELILANRISSSGFGQFSDADQESRDASSTNDRLRRCRNFPTAIRIQGRIIAK
jgi:hypothetical protein